VFGFHIMNSYISSAGTTQKVAQSLLEGNAVCIVERQFIVPFDNFV